MPKKKNNNTSMVTRLKRSRAYRIAYHDHDFIDTDDLRPVRLQLELLKPELILRRHKILSTIVVFGGTRIVQPSVARAKVKRLETRLRQKPTDAGLKKQLRKARTILAKSHFYDEAREFSRLVSLECQRDENHEYVIVTGGGPGIMEASNRGAHDVGAKSIGLNIKLPMEQEPNAYISPDLCMQFHYFALRKMHFFLRARALLAFPGGYGTMDELFEALTLVQTRVIKRLPIILFGEQYWRRLIDFDYLVREGTIDEEDIRLFVYTDKASEAWEYIKYFYESRGNGRPRPF